MAPNLPVLFVKIPSPTHEFEQLMTHHRNDIRSLQRTQDRHHVPAFDSLSSDECLAEPMMISDSLSDSSFPPSSKESTEIPVFQALLEMGFVNPMTSGVNSEDIRDANDIVLIESVFVERNDVVPQMTNFCRLILLNHLVKSTSLLNVIHTRCLETFILTAFDMARDMMVTPRRLEFAQQKENDLYNSLMDIALKKQDEIRRIISETISDIREGLLDKAAEHEFTGKYMIMMMYDL